LASSAKKRLENEAQLKGSTASHLYALFKLAEFIPAEKDKQEAYASFSPVQERETHCESAWPLTERLAAAIASTPRIRLVSNRLQHLLGR
jgi:hypothetical protein